MHAGQNIVKGVVGVHQKTTEHMIDIETINNDKGILKYID